MFHPAIDTTIDGRIWQTTAVLVDIRHQWYRGEGKWINKQTTESDYLTGHEVQIGENIVETAFLHSAPRPKLMHRWVHGVKCVKAPVTAAKKAGPADAEAGSRHPHATDVRRVRTR